MCGANIWLNYNKEVVIVDSVSDGALVPLTYNIDNTAGVTKMTWDTTSGMTGDFVFASVTLKAVGNPGDTCLLDLDVKELYDCVPPFNEIPRTVADGTFTIPSECGNMNVNPTSWSPTLNCGELDNEIITVSATGGTVEGVTVSKDSGPTWLSVSPTDLGDITSGSSKTFTMTASPPSETSGDFPYSVTVSNTCGTPSSRDVTGTITVPCPELSYSPTSHDFGDMCEGVTDSTTFEVWNSGTGTLTYTLSESCGWVDVNPASGSSAGEHDTITVDIDTTGLSEGLHTCDISIGSNGGSGTFTVTVNVVQCPELSYSPTSHDFGFEIWNSGTGTLTYSLSWHFGWVDVTPTSGSSTGEHDTITAEINTTGLAVGAGASCNIAISSNGGSDTFSVTVNIIPSTGAISVTSTPSGATIDLDGYVGPIVTTPYTFTNVPAGVHTITLTLTGYLDWSTSVQVTAGETTYVHATLTPIATGDIKINEIMYNPSTEQGSDADMEWIELYNNDTKEVNISGWTIDDNPISDNVMQPGDYIVLARNKTAFEAYYGALSCSVIDVTFALANSGDTIVLRNSAGAEIDSVTYQDSWGADGNGKTLERKATGGWAESLEDGGTPCHQNSVTSCFIATAAYGTPLHEDINVLRDFRDKYMMPNPAGRAFVKIYYSTSPPLADAIRANEALMALVREGLVKPLVDITGMFVG
jgi:hypothetical protein